MLKVLLVDDDQDILMLLSLVISAKMECTILTTTSGQEALKILEKEKIDIIVSDYNLGGMTGGEICQRAMEKNSDMSYVILSADIVDDKDDVRNLFKISSNGLLILKPFENDQLIFILSHISKGKCTDFINGDYISVMASAVFSSFKDQAVFFRLNENKIVKILSEDDEKKEEKLQEYIDKGANNFWVHRDSFRAIIDTKLKVIAERLGAEIGVDLQIISTAAIHQTIKYLGIDQQVIGVSDMVIKNVVKTIQKEKKIWDLLSDALKGHGYIYKLAMLTCYISVGIFENMDWYFDQATSKLVTASMFQDIGLTSEEHVKMVDAKELKGLKGNELTKVKNHPLDACKVIEKINGVYFDFHKVLLYHHERPDSPSFHAPINFDNLGNLEKIFIVAVDISQKILKHSELDHKLLEIEFQSVEDIFSDGAFKTVMEAFKDLFGRLSP